MPRKPREEVADGIHHVFARGNNKERIYRDDDDRELYLDLLQRAIEWARWHCLAFCLMDNHVHLLIHTPDPNLGDGMQRLHGRFGRKFNDRHGRSGHVFQGRFGSNRVTHDLQMWLTARYIARNPVEAGMCTKAEEWLWSSHSLVVHGTVPAWVDGARLLSYFDAHGGDPVALYRSFVDAELQQ